MNRHERRKAAKTDIGFTQNESGLLIPDNIATHAGFGCPKHDDHFLISLGADQDKGVITEATKSFLKKHDECGDLHTIEKRGGRLFVTGLIKKQVS